MKGEWSSSGEPLYFDSRMTLVVLQQDDDKELYRARRVGRGSRLVTNVWHMGGRQACSTHVDQELYTRRAESKNEIWREKQHKRL